ncbi:DUF6735 family protein [Halostella litorea]|uniref:DUF6735 family protein n=1 Tax=Halostella litorea TaxID=2528831 RepID=UPI001092AB58|nr:DUF6735 family protein [Halostella litorea]
MAHRALVAYERPDGDYDLHRSRWGGADLSLARRITARTPFGGPGAAWTGRSPTPPAELPPEAGSRPVETRPTAVGLDFDDVVAAVNPREHEALFVVAPDYDVTAYLPLWFGLPGVAPDVTAGALVAADPDGGPYGGPRLRRWFRATKGVVADLTARGALTRDEAVAYLADRVQRRVGDRREVIPVA